MKSKKWLVINFLCIIAIVCSTLFVSSLIKQEAEPETEKTDSVNSETNDAGLGSIVFIDEIDEKSKEKMLEYNNYFAAEYGHFDVEYNKNLKEPEDGWIDGLVAEHFFDDSGFGMVVYSEYPGMHKKYDLVWRTTDFGKTWVMNPEHESALSCSGMELCGTHLFSTYYNSVSMEGFVVHSDNYGETFEYFLPEDVFEQLGIDVPTDSGLVEGIWMDIQFVDEDNEQIFLSITDEDMDGNEQLIFIGKFDMQLNLIQHIYTDNEYIDKEIK